MANPRHNKQTANRRGAMGGGMMRKRPGYKKGGKAFPTTHFPNPTPIIFYLRHYGISVFP